MFAESNLSQSSPVESNVSLLAGVRAIPQPEAPRPVRILVVDADSGTRSQVRTWLEYRTGFELTAECSTTWGAAKAIEDTHPEICVVDVGTLNGAGREFKEINPHRQQPVLIALAQTSQEALEAFELSAAAFLLKPVDRRHFDQALNRAHTQLQTAQEASLLHRILDRLENIAPKSPKYLDQILVKTSELSFFVKVKEIDWIESEDHYVRLHTKKQSYLIRENLSQLENQLNPRHFARIHRSMIVNLDEIQSLSPLFHGDVRLVLRTGQELTLSRRYRKNVTK